MKGLMLKMWTVDPRTFRVPPESYKGLPALKRTLVLTTTQIGTFEMEVAHDPVSMAPMLVIC